MRYLAFLLAALSFARAAEPRPCPKVLAVLPTSTELLWETPVLGHETRERFELRECGGLQVYAFERGNMQPSLRMEAGDNYPPYLFHISNVLAFQSLGGASDHVYVFQFSKGKPRLVVRMATKDMMSVSVEQVKRMVTLSIPPTTYSSDDQTWPTAAPPRKFVLGLE